MHLSLVLLQYPVRADFHVPDTTVGVPLYICGGGTIPLLMAWLDSGMSAGSATAFMITGPATKITNLGAIKIVLGYRHFVFYLAFVMLFALLSGFIADCLL